MCVIKQGVNGLLAVYTHVYVGQIALSLAAFSPSRDDSREAQLADKLTIHADCLKGHIFPSVDASSNHLDFKHDKFISIHVFLPKWKYVGGLLQIKTAPEF